MLHFQACIRTVPINYSRDDKEEDLLEAVGHGEDAHTDDAVGKGHHGAVHPANRSITPLLINQPIKLHFMSKEHRLCIQS
jgi:hypothetical protein